MDDFSGKVVIITGAGSGIGRALAIKMSNAGAELALNDQNEDTLRETAEVIASIKNQVKVSIHPADVSNPEQVANFVDEVIKEHGRADILINNAGVALGRLEVGEMTMDQWNWIMDINFKGNLLCTRGFLPHLFQSKDGHIVNVSSIFGLAAVKERAGYCASKFAIVGLTESLRQELSGSNIRVSLVLPGGVRTNITYSARGWKNEDEHQKAARLQKEGSMISPEKAARIIVKGIKKNKYRILVGADAKLLDLISRLLPSYYGWIMNYFISRAERTRR
jgi:NADP-dependent 3-hydroxy acid dehydrogenase YdfG